MDGMVVTSIDACWGNYYRCFCGIVSVILSVFIQTYKRYQAGNCSNCPLNGACHKSKTNRIIEINVNLKRQKQKAHELLNSEEGIRHRKKRCFDVEPVFANIKQNHGFRRFMLRGKEKVSIEWGLLAIAQNIRKKAA